jgi:hypothetical protein
MRNIIGSQIGRIMGAPFEPMGDPALTALRAQTIARIGNSPRPQSWPHEAAMPSRKPKRSSSRGAILSPADAKAQLDRMAHRRAVATLNRIVATATQRPVSLGEAKRTLAKIEARNQTRHGIESRRQVITVPIAVDDRIRR